MQTLGSRTVTPIPEVGVEFDEYVAARRTALVRSVVLLGCPTADAEDVVQAALLRCYRHWRRVQRADRPDAYVYRVLVNTLRDAQARRWTGELPTEDLPDPGIDAEHTTGLAVRAAVARMSQAQRDVVRGLFTRPNCATGPRR